METELEALGIRRGDHPHLHPRIHVLAWLSSPQASGTVERIIDSRSSNDSGNPGRRGKHGYKTLVHRRRSIVERLYRNRTRPMTHIPRLFCLDCRHEMLISKTGDRLQVNTSDGNPYYKIHVDTYECPACSSEVSYVSPTTEPRAHHFEPTFDHLAGDWKEVRLNS